MGLRGRVSKVFVKQWFICNIFKWEKRCLLRILYRAFFPRMQGLPLQFSVTTFFGLRHHHGTSDEFLDHFDCLWTLLFEIRGGICYLLLFVHYYQRSHVPLIPLDQTIVTVSRTSFPGLTLHLFFKYKWPAIHSVWADNLYIWQFGIKSNINRVLW